MYKKRVVVCLDVKNGRTTKGIKFKNNVDIGNPVSMAKKYYEEGADELVFYDITASSEDRGIIIDVVKDVAKQVFIPLCVGGGIKSIEDIRKVIDAGAEKISLNSQAVKNPAIITEGAKVFGSQCIVLGMDVKADKDFPSGYKIVINGGRENTNLDALEWAKRGENLGAGEIVLNSIDTDGVCNGYEIKLTKLISENVGIPVVASGGAGEPKHLTQVLKEGKADAALIASIVHYGNYTIRDIKKELEKSGISVRNDF